MPIRPEMRALYPDNWEEISRYVRFEREHGRCQHCGRRHGEFVHRLPDGRWFDKTSHSWRDGKGRQCPWPDMFEFSSAKETKVVLAAAHTEHDPRINGNQFYDKVAALCQRCHLIYDLPHHVIRRKITHAARKAAGDLFFGYYDRPEFLLVPEGYAPLGHVVK